MFSLKKRKTFWNQKIPSTDFGAKPRGRRFYTYFISKRVYLFMGMADKNFMVMVVGVLEKNPLIPLGRNLEERKQRLLCQKNWH